MKEGWQEKKLGEVCKIINGGTPLTTKKEYWGSEHLWITPAEMSNLQTPYIYDTRRKLSSLGLSKSSATLIQPYSVIMSSRAPIGNLVINTAPMATNQGCKSFSPNSLLDYKFLYYSILNKRQYIISLGDGATFDEVSSIKLKNVTIPLPPLPEQHRIVSIIDKVFEALTQAKKETENNLLNVKEIFQSELNRIFDKKGDGWEEKKLIDLCFFENGDRGKNYPSRSFQKSSGIPFINAGHLAESHIDFTSMNYISEDTFNKLTSGKIKPYDILFCLRGSLGKFAKVNNLQKGAIASSLVIMRTKINLSQNFLFYYLKSSTCKKMIFKFAGGTAQPNLSATNLKEFKIFTPPIDEQQTVTNYLDKLQQNTTALEIEYANKLLYIEQLKHSILHQAFSGNL